MAPRPFLGGLRLRRLPRPCLGCHPCPAPALTPIVVAAAQHGKPQTVRARHHSTSTHGGSGSVSHDEMSHFTALADKWWDPHGPSRVLHMMNPLRHEFIQRCLFASTPSATTTTTTTTTTTNGLDYLDIGCGGGIFAESVARTIPLISDNNNDKGNGKNSSVSFSPVTRARSVTAIDPAPTMIDVAAEHAREDPALHAHLQSGVFAYEATSLEDMTAQTTPQEATKSFDIITIFEVLEHLDYPTPSQFPSPTTSTSPSPSPSPITTFLAQSLSLLRPGGWLIGSTMARTPLSYIIHKLLAEAPWPIGVVPPGTHDWHKFIDPPELQRAAVAATREESTRLKPSSTRHANNASEDGGRLREDPAFDMRFEALGAVYLPGWGWRFAKGAEEWGNYFFAIRKG